MRRIEKKSEEDARQIFSPSTERDQFYAFKIGYLAGFRAARNEISDYLSKLVEQSGSSYSGAIREKLKRWGEELL